MRKILIVVDMQNDFVTGALGTHEAQAIVPNVEAKIQEYASIPNHMVVYTRDTHFDNYAETQEGKKLPVPHCIKNSKGWEIIPELIIADRGSHIVDKMTFGARAWDWFFGAAPQLIESIELVGVCTDICVVSNALIIKALYPEIPIIVDASCCAGTTPENHAAALQVMKCCQIDVIGE